MNRRMIDGSLWANEKFSELPPMAALLQIGLINLADDQGRTKAHPAYLRSQIFPYRNVTNKQVSQWLSLIVANGTAILYRVDDKEYLQLANWWEYQTHSFAAASEYPRPHGWQDRVRFTGKNRTIYTCNWIVSSGVQLDDTCDQDGNPLPPLARPHAQPGSQPLAQPPDRPIAPLIEDKDKEEDKDDDQSNAASGESSAPDEEPPLSQKIHDRLQAEWMTVNKSQLDNHLALAQRYGYPAWLVGFEACKRGQRSSHSYVEKAIVSAIDRNPRLDKPKPKPPVSERLFYTDPVTGVKREVFM